MFITSSEPKTKKLHEYDFAFVNGAVLPVTVDLDAGDTIVTSDERITIKLVPKPAFSNPDELLPGEDISIFVKHLMSIQKRERQVVVLSRDQQAAWARDLGLKSP